MLSAFIVILIRILAVKFHWQLPVLKGEDTSESSTGGILKGILFLVLIPCSLLQSKAQVQQIFDPNVRTLTLTVNDDPTLPPYMPLGGRQHIDIEWDEMSHNYKRYVYHIDHCDWNWEPTDADLYALLATHSPEGTATPLERQLPSANL